MKKGGGGHIGLEKERITSVAEQLALVSHMFLENCVFFFCFFFAVLAKSRDFFLSSCFFPPELCFCICSKVFPVHADTTFLRGLPCGVTCGESGFGSGSRKSNGILTIYLKLYVSLGFTTFIFRDCA